MKTLRNLAVLTPLVLVVMAMGYPEDTFVSHKATQKANARNAAESAQPGKACPDSKQPRSVIVSLPGEKSNCCARELSNYPG
jgi:hypothetical protein